MARPPPHVLLRMLEPWLARVRGRLQISFNVFVDQRTMADIFWIRWRVPANGTVSVDDVEAMELLELLVRVDFRAGWTLLLEFTGSIAYLEQVLDACSVVEGTSGVLRPRYELVSWREPFTATTFKQAMRWILFTVDLDDHSPMYYPVRQTLLQCCVDSNEHGRVVQPPRHVKDRIAIKIEANLWGRNTKEVSSFIDEVAAAAVLARQPDRLQLSHAWQEACGRSSLTLSQVFTFDTIEFSLHATPLTDRMMTSSLEKLDCELPDHFTSRGGDIRKFWAWAVYTLIGAEAPSTIQYLRLGLEELTSAIVEVFTAVLEAPDPLVYRREGEFRMPLTEVDQRVPAVVEVVPNATLFTANRLGELKTENRPETLRVVDDTPEKNYVCVIYPGAGTCWVHRSQISQRREIVLPSTRRRFDCLCLGISMFTGLISRMSSNTLGPI